MSDIDLNSPEVKAAIKAAVTEATEGLIAKRDELLGEVKNLRKGKAIDPADLEKLEAQVETLQTQLKESDKAAKKLAGERDTAVKAAADADGNLSKLLVDNGLSDALAQAGVNNPHLSKAAKAVLAAQVQLVVDGDKKVAKIGDKLLSDAVKEWAGTDEGKHFVAAAPASGSGSQGGHKGAGGAASITRAQFEGLDSTARSAHFASGGTITD